MDFSTARLMLPALMLVTVATNLIPLYGVANWGWAAKDIILLYWVETVIIGLTYLLRIWTKVNSAKPLPTSWPGRALYIVGNLVARTFISAPFVVHFGGFCFILGMAVLSLFFFHTENFNHHMYRQVYEAGLSDGLYLAALCLLASHLSSLSAFWFKSGRFRQDKGTDGILRTYVRIVTLMAVIVLPAKMASEQDDALIAILVLVGLKIFFDLFFLVLDARKSAVHKEQVI